MFDACFGHPDGDDAYSWFSEDFVASDVDRICCECCCAIPIGIEHSVLRASWDVDEFGELQPGAQVDTWDICPTCELIRESLFPWGWILGEMWAAIHEQYCDEDAEDEDEAACICPETAWRSCG